MKVLVVLAVVAAVSALPRVQEWEQWKQVRELRAAAGRETTRQQQNYSSRPAVAIGRAHTYILDWHRRTREAVCVEDCELLAI